MKRTFITTPSAAAGGPARVLALSLALALAASAASALDAPHRPGGVVDCLFCHIAHTALGPVQTNLAGTNAFFCQQCHHSAGSAPDTALPDGDRADPGTSGTSHAWGVDATNATLGTTLPSNAEMLLRIDDNGTPGDDTDDLIVCSTCHDQHNSNKDFPFLRIANTNNALCNECHGAWVMTDAGKDAYTGSALSHPVGFAVPGTDGYHAPSNLPLEGGNIVCTSCHAMHFGTSGASQDATATTGSIATSFKVSGTPWTPNEFQGDRIFFKSGANAGRSRLVANNDSNTINWVSPLQNASNGDQSVAEFDTASIQTTGAGDGYVLRQTKSADALCNECHEVQIHNKTNTGSARSEWGDTFTCLTCHKPHGSKNIFLVNETITVGAGDGAPFAGAFDVDFRSMTTGIEDYGLAEEDGGANGIAAGNGVCEGCHTDTTVFNNVASGAVGANGTHDTGTCTGCHPHGDGFKPMAGGCLGCHSGVKGTVGPGTDYRRQVVGTGGDFERTAHHVYTGAAESVTADDCSVCHDQTSHADNAPVDPGALLKDPDGGASFTYDGTGGSIEGFCVNCHDSDGATDSATVPLQPFSDLQTPPTDIAATWTGSAHDTGLATEACQSCHGGADGTRSGLSYDQNAHGSARASLLSALVAGETVSDWTEEGACYACHDSDGPSTADVETDFGYAKHHRVLDSEQAAYGGRAAECSTCHGALLHDMPASPVRANSNAASRAIINAPKGYDGASVVGTITKEYELCLLCHSDYSPGTSDPGDGGTGSSNIWGQFASGVEIHYSTTGAGGSWISVGKAPVADRSFAWTIPSENSSNCYVRVQQVGGGASDVSDNAFQISSGAPDAFDVTFPNGAETWLVNNVVDITWTSGGISGNVDVHYYDGSGWNTVALNTANDGAEEWTIPSDPQFPSANCQIRVQETGGGVSDTTNAFEVLTSAAEITVTSPVGYETWRVGEARTITWTTTYSSGNVEIQYSTNSGGAWTKIDDKIPVTQLSFIWTVPNDVSTTCQIRIEEDTNSPDWWDHSNADFTIAAAITPPYVKVTSPDDGTEHWGPGHVWNITWDYGGLSTTAHPVLTAGSNPYCNSTTMVASWNDGAGEHNTMWCSDCHRTENANGPHGFDTASDATMRVWGGLTAVEFNTGSGDWHTPLCVKCHKVTSYCTGVTGSGWDNHNMSQHRVAGHSGDGTYGGCLTCHYGGYMTTVHGGNHEDWFMTGEQLEAGGGAITATTCAAAGIGNCGGHGDKGY